MDKLDKLYRRLDYAYDNQDYDSVAFYQELINNYEKAERMKEIKISKFRNIDRERIYYFDDIGRIPR